MQEPEFGPIKRQASPQAWRRLRAAIGPGEARDLAADIAEYTGADAAEIAFALVDLDWESKEQAEGITLGLGEWDEDPS